MGFQALHTRLIAHIQHKLRSGEATERGLARVTGVSQPHLHNVLKGLRRFSLEMADHVMERLQIEIWELQERQTSPANSESTEAPLLEGIIGPGRPFPDLGKWGGRMPFLRADLAGLELPLAARLGADAESRIFRAGDVALLEPAAEWTETAGYCAIDTGESGLIRWVERKGDRLSVRAEQGGAETGCIAVADRNMLEVVRARVVWIGRYLRGS